jgi:hypothetical protein
VLQCYNFYWVTVAFVLVLGHSISFAIGISFASGESHPRIFDLLIAAFQCYFPSAFVDGQRPCVSTFVDSTSPAHPGHYSSRFLCRNSLSTLTGMAARYRATVAVRFGGFTELRQIVTCASGCSSMDPFFLFIYSALPSPLGSIGLGSVES